MRVRIICQESSVADLTFDWRLTRLPNGQRLITIARPGTTNLAVRVFVRAGSRYELEHKPADPCRAPLGLAHLAEHRLFKGTRRHSPREVFGAVERLGGVLDPGTTKEYLTVSAVVPRQGLVAALMSSPKCWLSLPCAKRILPGEAGCAGRHAPRPRRRGDHL